MEYWDFLRIVYNKRIKIDDTYYGHSWKKIIRLKELVGAINIGCDFDQDGMCSKVRQRSLEIERELENDPDVRIELAGEMDRYCCVECRPMVGFFGVIQNDEKVLETLADRFDDKLGFWRKGHGCLLEPMYRSIACLRYRCGHVKVTHPLSAADKKLITALFQRWWLNTA